MKNTTFINKTNEVIITKVNEANGWLHCMSAHPVNYNGIEYRTCEALFQARRFDGFPQVQKEIREQKSPLVAKMKARKNKDLLNRGAKWDESTDDLDLMKECLRLKFDQHPDLRAELIKTGDAKIIEDCTTHDRESARFWGQVLKNGKWIGENHLGEILMEIREDIK